MLYIHYLPDSAKPPMGRRPPRLIIISVDRGLIQSQAGRSPRCTDTTSVKGSRNPRRATRCACPRFPEAPRGEARSPLFRCCRPPAGARVPVFLWLTPHLGPPVPKCYTTVPASRGAALQAGACLGRTLPQGCPGLREGHTPIRTEETPSMGSAALANVFTRPWHCAAAAWVRS